MSPCLTVYLHVYPPVCLPVYQHVYMSVCYLHIYLHAYLSTCLLTCLSAWLSTYVYLAFCLDIRHAYVSTFMSTYLHVPACPTCIPLYVACLHNQLQSWIHTCLTASAVSIFENM